MATHSSILAWRIPGTEEPSGLPSMGSHRVGHDWSDLAAAVAAAEPIIYFNIQKKCFLHTSQVDRQKSQFRSVAQSCMTLCNPMDCSTPGLPVHHQLPEFTQTHVHWVSDAIQPSYPLLPPSPSPSIFPSIRVFSNESVLHIRWPKYWSFSFSIRPSNDYSGLISFRMDWLDLFALQGTLKSLLQHHSSKASILQHATL